MDTTARQWYLSVVRLHRRCNHSQLVVVITLVETGQTIETVVGRHERNPHLERSHLLKDASPRSHLDVRICLKSGRGRNSGREPLWSTCISLNEILSRQRKTRDGGTRVAVRLEPTSVHNPNIARSSLRVNGRASVTLSLSTCETSRVEPLENILYEDSESFSSDGEQTKVSIDTAELEAVSDDLPPPYDERIRIRRPWRNGYCVNPSHGPGYCSSEQSDFAPTPPESPIDPQKTSVAEEIRTPSEPRILPQFQGQTGIPSELSLVESVLNIVSPYSELSRSGCDYEKLLSRLTNEWYTVGASLLATAGLSVTVFGYARDSLTSIPGFALQTVTIGSITAGIGLVIDVWLLLFYSGADAAKFQAIARDVFGKYFFFCLSCKLPMLCLAVSICALMVFLAAVAWETSPAAVLVLCCLAGVLITLQYLVYGFSSIIDLACIAACRIRTLSSPRPPSRTITVPPTSSSGHSTIEIPPSPNVS